MRVLVAATGEGSLTQIYYTSTDQDSSGSKVSLERTVSWFLIAAGKLTSTAGFGF